MIIGRSPAIQRARDLAERYACTQLSVLLVGPTGTGKELFAQHIHRLSGRKGPLIDVNCCALPCEMVDSLLFGHTRGAFTGAIASTVGHVARSHGGTLFLDEIESLSLEAQGKLLRVLETREVQPLGAGAKQPVDLRVIGAAQNGIKAELNNGAFRRDLYQRLAGIVIELPPLAARLEDLLPLAEHFAALQGQRLEPGARTVLLNHAWPGNVRELRLALERASQLVSNGTLSGVAVAEAIELGVLADEAPVVRDARTKLVRICEAHAWNVREITRALGIGRTTLFRRLREVDLSLREAKKYHFVPHCSEQSGTLGAGARSADS